MYFCTCPMAYQLLNKVRMKWILRESMVLYAPSQHFSRSIKWRIPLKEITELQFASHTCLEWMSRYLSLQTYYFCAKLRMNKQKTRCKKDTSIRNLKKNYTDEHFLNPKPILSMVIQLSGIPLHYIRQHQSAVPISDAVVIDYKQTQWH